MQKLEDEAGRPLRDNVKIYHAVQKDNRLIIKYLAKAAKRKGWPPWGYPAEAL